MEYFIIDDCDTLDVIESLFPFALQNKTSEFVVGVPVFNALLVKGANEEKYNHSNYKRLNTPIVDITWTPGGIGLFYPGSYLIGGIVDSEEEAKNIIKKIFTVISSFFKDNITRVNRRNDFLVNNKKLSGSFCAKTLNNQYAFGLYINNIAKTRIIRQTSNNKKDAVVGLTEYSINIDDVVDKIHKQFSENWTHISTSSLKDKVVKK